jgi:hypothetical protein
LGIVGAVLLLAGILRAAQPGARSGLVPPGA